MIELFYLWWDIDSYFIFYVLDLVWNRIMGFWHELAYATIMVWWDELACAAVDGFIYVSFTIIYINICILVHAPASSMRRPASQPERRPASLRERHAAACRHQAASGMHAASGQPDRAGRPATCSQRPGAGQRLAASGQGMRQRHAVRKKGQGQKRQIMSQIHVFLQENWLKGVQIL
jgi:hypothetical protein